jgi:PilZ domain
MLDMTTMMSNALVIAKRRERRRSTRASLYVDFMVCGDGGQWQERTCALSLNAHGVLVDLGTRVAIGQRVLVRNPENFAEREGRLVRLGRGYGSRKEVAIEFTNPAPDFWLKPRRVTVQLCASVASEGSG